MVDLIVGATVGEVAKAGGGVLSRLLGPTADEMGAQLHRWYKHKNVERVAKRAEAKADTDTPGGIPPRVAAEVFEKAQWADDEFVSEYLSGVLASARTPEGTDDSGVSWTALVGRLSSAQLRLHYILYSTGRHHLVGREINTVNDLDNFPILIPLVPVLRALGGGADAFNEGIMNLTREGLVSERSDIDPQGERLAAGKLAPGEPAMLYRLSNAGVMLYMRGGGSRETRVRAIADLAIATKFVGLDEISIPIAGSSLQNDLPDQR